MYNLLNLKIDLYQLLLAKSHQSNMDELSDVDDSDSDEKAESEENEGEEGDGTSVGLEIDDYAVVGLTKRPLGSPFYGYLPTDTASLDSIFGDSETLFMVSADRYIEVLEEADQESEEDDTDNGSAADIAHIKSDREKLLKALEEESYQQGGTDDSSTDDDDDGDTDSSESTDVDENEIGEGDGAEDDIPSQVIARPRPVVGTLSLPSGQQRPGLQGHGQSPHGQAGRQLPVQTQARPQAQAKSSAYLGQPNRPNQHNR
jgi:hypothetical protein